MNATCTERNRQGQGRRITAARAAKLGTSAKYLLRVLCDYMGQKDFCWPSVKSLADEVGCSIQHLRRLMRALEAAGYIRTAARFRPDGSQASNMVHWAWNTEVPPPEHPRSALKYPENKQVNNTHADADASGCDLPLAKPEVTGSSPVGTTQDSSSRPVRTQRSKRYIRIDSDRFKESSHCLEIYDEALKGRLVKDGTANRLTFVAAWIEVQRKFEAGKVEDRSKLMRFLIGKPAVLAEYPTQSSEQRAHGVIRQFCQ